MSAHTVLFRSIVVLCAAAACLFAQSIYNQQIAGQVQDATGSALANAAVSVVNTDTNFTRTTKTNETGNYVVTELPVGKYRVTAETAGFKQAIVENVELGTDAHLEVNL